jgi:nucleoside 2-deoxyribosyltransferase
MEEDNPSGIGMAVEMGYAHGLGKTVILCLPENPTKVPYRYLEFMKKAADITFNNIDDAKNYLELYK